MVLPSALKFPDVYSKFISCFSFVNLALLPRFLRLDCVMSVDHYGHVFFMTLAPLLVFALGYVCFKVHTQQAPDEKTKKHLPWCSGTVALPRRPKASFGSSHKIAYSS